MTNEILNSNKVNIYCKLGEFATDIQNKSKYSVKDCTHANDNLKLASLLFASIYYQCIDDDTEESYCLDSEELCSIITKIYELLNNC